jgi:hypothetical protein
MAANLLTLYYRCHEVLRGTTMRRIVIALDAEPPFKFFDIIKYVE